MKSYVEGAITMMNQINPWHTYLTDQMHDKYGFPKHVASRMVSSWLKSIQNARTSYGRDAGRGEASYGVRIQAKTASTKG